MDGRQWDGGGAGKETPRWGGSLMGVLGEARTPPFVNKSVRGPGPGPTLSLGLSFSVGGQRARMRSKTCPLWDKDLS